MNRRHKNFLFRQSFFLVLAVTAFLVFAPRPSRSANAADKGGPGDFGGLRLENEKNLAIPPEAAGAVWRWLENNFNDNKEFLAKLSPNLSSAFAEELFTDDYFDTPDLSVLKAGGGVRHRRRLNYTDPADEKNGRELVQVKLSDVGDEGSRGEVKFAVKYPRKIKNNEDKHPLFGAVKRSERPQLSELLVKAGIAPLSLRPILANEQVRRRIYLSFSGKPFMTLSFDQTESKRWWAKIAYTSLEVELNEITYTQALPGEREQMRGLRAKVVGVIKKEFPFLEPETTPKYQKSFAALAAKIPFFRSLFRVGLL